MEEDGTEDGSHDASYDVDDEEEEDADDDEDLDDDGEEEEEEEEGGSAEGPAPDTTQRQPFDTSLPSVHTYLGGVHDVVTSANDFSELLSFPDGVCLPLFKLDGVVLFPGGTLPAIFHESYERAGVIAALGAPPPLRNFIAILMGQSRFDRRPQRTPVRVGCIAEIRQILRGPSGSINIVATGRCRFRLAAGDGLEAVEGTAVRVIPMIDAPDLPVPADIRCPPEAQAATLPETPSPTSSGSGPLGAAAGAAAAAAAAAPLAAPAGTGRRRRRGWEESCSGFSGLPGWVWKNYDPYSLAAALRELPAVKAAASREAALERSPTALAYWAAEHLPLDNANRQALLEAPSTVERLKLLHRLLATIDGVHCRRCGTQIASTSSIIAMSEEGGGGTYVNPHGVVSDLMTLASVRNCALEGSPSEEFSWFPGYAWTVAICECCFAFLGWRFTAVDRATYPRSFWGIQRAAVSSDRLQRRWPVDGGGGGGRRGAGAGVGAEAAPRLVGGLLEAFPEAGGGAGGTGSGGADAAQGGGGAAAGDGQNAADGPLPPALDIGWPGRWPPWGVRRRQFLLNLFQRGRAGGGEGDAAAEEGPGAAAAAAAAAAPSPAAGVAAAVVGASGDGGGLAGEETTGGGGSGGDAGTHQ